MPFVYKKTCYMTSVTDKKEYTNPQEAAIAANMEMIARESSSNHPSIHRIAEYVDTINKIKSGELVVICPD